MKKAKKKLNLEKENLYEETLFRDDQDDTEDCPCLYCNELYSRSKPGEHWVRCQQCKLWAHTECAGIQNRTKTFICEVCK